MFIVVNGYSHSDKVRQLVDLFDRAFFKPLSITDTKPSIDSYTPEERETILEAFRTKRPHYYEFVFFHFWQGPRPSESTALRREDVDLRYARARIHRSRVQGHEAGTENMRSNREIHLHENVVDVLSHENPSPLSGNRMITSSPHRTVRRSTRAIFRSANGCRSLRPRRSGRGRFTIRGIAT